MLRKKAIMKKIKDLLNRLSRFIKRIFVKKKPDQKKDNGFSFILERLVPELKNVDHETLFSSIKEGDIIYATTCTSLKRLSMLPPDHRVRPYIVAKKMNNRIIAFCGTSDSNVRFKHSFTLSSSRYNVRKTGKINTGEPKTLKPNMIVSIIGKLKPEDITLINMDILSKKEEGFHQLIGMGFPIREGLILKRTYGLYYVYSVVDKQITLYRLYKDMHKPLQVKLNGRPYFIDPSRPIIEEDLKRYNKLGFKEAKENYKDKIDKYHNRYQAKHIPMNSFAKNCSYSYPVGQVFDSRGSYMVYLYTINGVDYGFDENDLYDNQIRVKKLNSLDHCCLEEVMDKETLSYAVNDIARRFYNYGWLKDIIPKEYDTRTLS